MKKAENIIKIMIVLCFLPLVFSFSADGVAALFGCSLDEYQVTVCMVADVDVGTIFYHMLNANWWLIFTGPLAIILLVALISVKIFAALKRSSNANA